MQPQCPATACVCSCVQVCVYLTVSKCIFTCMDELTSLPRPIAPCPLAIAVSTVVIQGRCVQQQVFICLLCHHLLICGDYDKQTPKRYYMSPLGVDETSVLLNVSVSPK